ncbi:MAG: DDE-type integrase/transposase/recombinase [Opitutus sp.]|nr:DDE-type integrase/transposase/recombinase [Opitutus sp.]MCS6246552.1 DDE-type integrase/transposase/recombinase [Opitutus sp.]MCS6272763.1 DDE-type integrase/transposase/recombinase [Opitutus sp.]MCS6276395.1 DDE-type integrase/transposase/recombinase [Opitutus sp.]MCS6301957.1 DDE-type integrase/transposase/recombinase [Opitutus sp.]
MKNSFSADRYLTRLAALAVIVKPEILELIRNLSTQHHPAFSPSSSSMPRTYQSPKMGELRFCSGSLLERGVAHQLDADSAVAGFFTQVPLQDPLKGSSKVHVVDFVVLLSIPEKPPANWCPLKFIDVKNATWLRRHAGNPGCDYITKSETTGWGFPPGETAALNAYGAPYQVITEQDISAALANNSSFLADYYRSDCQPAPLALTAKAREYVTLNPGCTIETLLKEISGLSIDHCYRMVASSDLWVDLSRYEVMSHNTCRIFASAAVAKAFDIVERTRMDQDRSIRRAKFQKGELIVLSGRDHEVSYVDGDTVMLIDGHGNVLPMDLPALKRLEIDGKLRSYGVPKEGAAEIETKLRTANPSKWAKAVADYSRIEQYVTQGLRRAPKGVAKLNSTERAMLRRVRLSISKYGRRGALIGCLRASTPKAQHRSRLPQSTLDAMNEGIQIHYLKPGETCVAHAYSRYVGDCKSANIKTVTLRTFGRAIKRLSVSLVEKAKRGNYSAAKHNAPVSTSYDFGSAEHYMQRAHIDFSVADLSLLCKEQGVNLGTAWVIVMLDAYSRTVLATYISYEPPSAASTLCLFRECVRRHGRLPSQILSDNGSEFVNLSVEFFLSFYQIEFIRRPVGRPRWGAEMERFFGSMNKRVTDTLPGATAAMRTQLRISPSHSPDRLAAYTINELQGEIEKYCFKVYDELPHAGLNGMSPKQVREESLSRHGTRNHIQIDQDRTFRMITLPLVSGDGTAKIQAHNGVQVSTVLYWNNIFDSADLNGTRVPVRWDPLDITRVYAFARGEWHECLAPKLKRLRAKPPEQLAVASLELRRARLSYGRN